MQFRDNRQTDLASENPLRGCGEQTSHGVVYKGHQSARASAQSATVPPMPLTRLCRWHIHGSLSLALAAGTKDRSLWPREEGEKMRRGVAMDTGRERTGHYLDHVTFF